VRNPLQLKNGERMKTLILGLLLLPTLGFGKEVMRCNNGALSVTEDAKRSGQYIATIGDNGVVNFFENETTKYVTLTDSSNNKVTIQKKLSWMMNFEVITGKKFFKITDFRFYPETKSFATSGGPGSFMKPIGNGYQLQLNSGNMTSSHSVAYYEIGNWTFESCKLSL
jgi:hypothetical protein